ncbi:MAG: type IV toxin-antitoxin system AbiEi family antitoxin [Nocardioidaceae bacterium]
MSSGQAHSTLTLLEQTGYLAGRRLRPNRLDDLLDMWTAAYTRGLGQKLAVASYISPHGIHDFRDEVLNGPPAGGGIDVFALSGEAVPNLGLKRPRSVTVYTRDWTPRQAIRHRWRAAGTTAEADIHVRRQFWTPSTDNGLGAVYDPIAIWPVVYADLMTNGDERLAAVATEWRNRHRTA